MLDKERDTETNNDDFGARYYSSSFGRWTSPDWSAIPAPVPYANLTNPQTLNLYAMVSDNPETFADLDGHCPECVEEVVDEVAPEAGEILGWRVGHPSAPPKLKPLNFRVPDPSVLEGSGFRRSVTTAIPWNCYFGSRSGVHTLFSPC